MNKKKVFCFDIDGIICKTIDSNYIKAKPNFKTIKLINELYKKNKIIIFTSRYMGRNKDNIKKVKRLPKVKGIKEIMYPGQNKYKRYKMNFKKEIKISKIIKKELEILKTNHAFK